MSAKRAGLVDGGIAVTIGPGEFIDRLTILRLKAERLPDTGLRMAVARRLAGFEKQRRDLPEQPDLAHLETSLSAINRQLWDDEDTVRHLADRGDFGTAFVTVSRRIRDLNDQRAMLKTEIDRSFGFESTEAKSYRDRAEYASAAPD